MIFAINQLKSGIDCRKYFFWYIKWHPQSKQLKQWLISTKNPQEIYNILQKINTT
jgi:tRNA-dihydrouridine synthase